MKQMYVKHCPVCGSTHFKDYSQVTDFSVSQEDFSVVECANCSLLFTNPRPDDDDMQRYYKSDMYISHTNQRSGVFGKLYQALRRQNIKKKLKLIQKHNGQKGSLLDYGCGTGEFLAASASAGWEVQGIELSSEVRERAKSLYNLRVNDPSDIEAILNSALDVVTMWHVLEHITSLKETSKTIIEKIKPGGLLIVAVPNPQSWDAIYYNSYWAAWDVPIHLYHFKKQNIERFFSELGMTLLEIKKMPLDAFYIALLSEMYKTGKREWLKAAIIGLYSNIRTIGKTNSSSLTYVLQKPKT